MAEDEKADTPEAAKGKNKLLILIIAVIAIVGGGVGGYFFRG